jgi:hypothetical protein
MGLVVRKDARQFFGLVADLYQAPRRGACANLELIHLLKRVATVVIPLRG